MFLHVRLNCWLTYIVIHRKKLPRATGTDISEVPERFKAKVAVYVGDGYKISFVSENEVVLVKRKIRWFPLLLSIPTFVFPAVAATQFLSGIYCIKLQNEKGAIKLTTF